MCSGRDINIKELAILYPSLHDLIETCFDKSFASQTNILLVSRQMQTRGGRGKRSGDN